MTISEEDSMGIHTILTSESSTWCELNASMLGAVAQPFICGLVTYIVYRSFGEEVLFALQISRG